MSSSNKQPKPSITAMIMTDVVAIVALIVGGYLYLHGGQAIGSALVGGVTTAYFLHKTSLGTNTTLGNQIDTLLNMVASFLSSIQHVDKASTSTSTATATDKTVSPPGSSLSSGSDAP